MDLIVFSGQSNMQGQTEGLPQDNAPINGAWEYVYREDVLRPVQHPVGETFEENGQSLLLGAHNGGGSLVPAFCREYTRVSGREVIAVHAARGATTIAQWYPETFRYQVLVKKVLAAKDKVTERQKVDKICFVWLQGESDAIEGTSENEYYNYFIALKNALKKDLKVECFGLIKVGYFASQAPWYDVGTMQERVEKDEIIMRAQERIVQENSDCIMLTRVCVEMSKNTEYINPFESGHYNNKAMKRIGEEAAQELYRWTKSVVN